jgi:hypothetical protein
MFRSFTRAIFIAAIIAIASASLVTGVKSAPVLLEIQNKSLYDLRFTIEPTNKSMPTAKHTLAPGQMVTFDQAGTWYLTGELFHGSTLIKKLGDQMILMKVGDRMAHLIAVDDPIAKQLRWYVYYR